MAEGDSIRHRGVAARQTLENRNGLTVRCKKLSIRGQQSFPDRSAARAHRTRWLQRRKLLVYSLHAQPIPILRSAPALQQRETITWNEYCTNIMFHPTCKRLRIRNQVMDGG